MLEECERQALVHRNELSQLRTENKIERLRDDLDDAKIYKVMSNHQERLRGWLHHLV